MKDFGDVYGEYWDLVYGFLFRLCQNEHFAEELAQETFFRAMRAWDSFRGDSSVSTWLCAIAKRLYYSSLRKTPVLPIDELPMGETPDIAEQLLDGDRQMIVQRILHQLPEPYREVFTLRTLCDLSHGQIGELFGKSDNWARVTYLPGKTAACASHEGGRSRMKTDCNVARDLMPLCIDDAASEESVKYLNDHLAQCEECKALFDDMKAAMPKREAGKTAQEQAQFGQLAHMMKQMHRWRVWRNVIIGILTGILAVVGVYAGWQGLMVQYHAEYPVKEYEVSLAQLNDGRVVVGVNYLQSKRNIGLVIGGSSKSLRIWFETTIIPQNMATENKNGPVYIISNIEKIDTIAIGHSGEQIVWRRGDAIAKASEEMEAYYRADTEMSQYWAEVTQELRGEIDWEGGEESRTRRESLQTRLESLRVQVPEWQ